MYAVILITVIATVCCFSTGRYFIRNALASAARSADNMDQMAMRIQSRVRAETAKELQRNGTTIEELNKAIGL